MELEQFVNDHPDETRHQAFRDHYKGIKRDILPLPRAPPSSRVPGVPGPSSSEPSVQHAHTTETHLASSGVGMGPSSTSLGKRRRVEIDQDSDASAGELRHIIIDKYPGSGPHISDSHVQPSSEKDYKTVSALLKDARRSGSNTAR